MSDSALSKQLATLEEAGYVQLERRKRLRAQLTPGGPRRVPGARRGAA